MKYIGKKIHKSDGNALVKGLPVYTDDLGINNNTLIIKILRNPHPNAVIKSIDVSEALAMDGVECALTYKDVPDVYFTLAGQSYPEPSAYDRRVLDRHVRYVGDEVAIVAAVDEKTALKALKKIHVEYDVLEPVLDLDTALDNKALVHPVQPHTNFDIGCDASRNIASTTYTEQGNVDEVLKSCDAVSGLRCRTQAQAHAMMETYRASVAIDYNGRLVVTSSTQIPFHVRRHLSRILGIPKSMIKIIKPRLGGGFGGKQTATAELFPALVTHITKKPSKIIYTRHETFSCSTSRHAMMLDVRLGADRNGRIKAIDIHSFSDTGAYGEHAPTVFYVVGHKTLPLYHSEACRYYGHALYTNKMPAGALRGYGATQGTFAQESAMNQLSDMLGIDPCELRLMNLLDEGDVHHELDGSIPGNPAVLKSSALKKCIETGKKMIGWDEKYPRVVIDDRYVKGYGMAVTMQGSGIAKIDTATAFIKLNDGGFFTLIHSASDMGQGSDTVLLQMAAEVLEVDIKNIIVTSDDIDTVPYDPGAYASSGTYVTGNAVIAAAEDMKRQITETAARMLHTDAESIEYGGDVIRSKDGSSISLREIGEKLCGFTGKDQLIAKGTYGGDTSPPPFVAGFAEVTVDTETGRCAVTDFCAVADCGTVINENLARVQLEGGIAQGIGMALYEDVIYSSTGRMATDTFMTYKIPCRKDFNCIRTAFESSYEPTGPFGAKSLGEVVINTPAPAIAHAVYNAVGVRVTELPITPEKVLMGMLKKDG